MVTNKLKLALILSAFLFAVTTLPSIYSSVVSSGLVPSNGSDQVAVTYAALPNFSNKCPANLICTPIPVQPAGCPFGYTCTIKPVEPLDVSGMSCSIYVDGNRIPTVTTVGKPTGGSSAYSYTVFSPNGPVETVPANKVPGKHGYTQNQGGPSQYLSVASGTSTAKVQCSYSKYSIDLTSSSTMPVSSSPNQLGQPFVFTVQPSDITSKSMLFRLSLSCPTGVTAPMPGSPVIDACSTPVNLIRTNTGNYFTMIAIKNSTNSLKSVNATAQALDSTYGISNAEVQATDGDTVSVKPIWTKPVTALDVSGVSCSVSVTGANNADVFTFTGTTTGATAPYTYTLSNVIYGSEPVSFAATVPGTLGKDMYYNLGVSGSYLKVTSKDGQTANVSCK